MRYLREVIKRVNKNEDAHEDQKQKSCTGLVNVYRLRNTRVSQSDTRLAWIWFHKISAMYRDLKHQDTLQELLEIKNLKSPASFSSLQIYQPIEPNLPVKLQVLPTNLKEIQPRPLQVGIAKILDFIRMITGTR